ncbi:MAG TPA: hypothetical protein VMX17_14490 [Candidatus Glassbacteria bacterium]|nr:hypothetical protein [Candidatus Glassbacteria bacterium]
MGAYSTRYITKQQAIRIIKHYIDNIECMDDNDLCDLLFDVIGRDKLYNFVIVKEEQLEKQLERSDVSDLFHKD